MKKLILAAASCLSLTACSLLLEDAGASRPGAEKAIASQADAGPPTVKEARRFIAAAETELAEMSEYAARTYWVQATYINDDTNWLASKVGAEYTETAVRLANESKRFEGLKLPRDLKRKFQALRAGITLPAPSSPGAARELSEISTRLDAAYSTSKVPFEGENKTLEDLSAIMAHNRDPKTLKAVWEGWRTVAPPMKDDYARMVEIANEGARELGFDNLADMWLSNYDMPPAEMEAEVERLWTQVAPLYTALHCHVRARLNQRYGDAVQPADGMIRADLLGNMWAQQWSDIYDIVKPEGPAGPSYDLTEKLEAAGYDATKMIRAGEAFFSSLGLAPLPETFWRRSMITRPADREVVCHASAWDIDDKDDVRIKMCTQVTAEDFQTIHHELGHNYYQRAYKEQDYLFRGGANDGFHEAIGDFVALSITPDYLREIGLISEAEIPPPEADTGLLMHQALDKIAFLPFGLMVDKWRWEVFRGDVTPDGYNDEWVRLRRQYQGVTPPGPRPADAFDPGAKYHIPGNTPYLRYFLSFVMQFQFHKAACEAAGWDGPLHRCTIYGNEKVGKRFNKMLEMGASKPWPDALEAFTGSREIDGSAIIEYFEPLMDWLAEENEGRSCGWE